MHFHDLQNAQRNLEIVQINKSRGTYLRICHLADCKHHLSNSPGYSDEVLCDNFGKYLWLISAQQLVYVFPAFREFAQCAALWVYSQRMAISHVLVRACLEPNNYMGETTCKFSALF